MAENSKIEWTDHTFNPWRGCTKISAGCANCYAETLSKRNPATLGIWGDNGTRVVASESYWKQPLKWNREAAAAGERRRVFCASLADVFEDRADLIEPRRRLFDLINETPDLDWLLLTKRPENVGRLFDDVRRHFGWDEDMSVMNIWLGTTVENQEQADKRIPELLKIPARVRFLSCEPLLGPIQLGVSFVGGSFSLYDYGVPESRFHWVIAGGESGTNARPMNPFWAHNLQWQCQKAGIPFHFKQWGEWVDFSQVPDELENKVKLHWFEDGECVGRIGKRAAGRLLDGREHNDFPRTEAK